MVLCEDAASAAVRVLAVTAFCWDLGRPLTPRLRCCRLPYCGCGTWLNRSHQTDLVRELGLQTRVASELRRINDSLLNQPPLT